MIELLKWWIVYNQEKHQENKVSAKSKIAPKSSYGLVMARFMNRRTVYNREKHQENKVDGSEKAQLMQFAVIPVGGQSRPLKTFAYHLNPGIIPPDMDFPGEVLPYTISKTFKGPDLKKHFGWEELPLVHWARFIVNDPNLEVNPSFVEKV